MAKVRLRDRVVPSKATFIQTAAKQHAELMELAHDVERLQAVIRVLHKELAYERSRTIWSRIREKVEAWIRDLVKDTAHLGGWQ